MAEHVRVRKPRKRGETPAARAERAPTEAPAEAPAPPELVEA
jgi:hypothetical protein